jgi:hypothetical protein
MSFMKVQIPDDGTYDFDFKSSFFAGRTGNLLNQDAIYQHGR